MSGEDSSHFKFAVDFVHLPADILLQIFAEVCVRDILALRQTCKFLDAFSRERSVWHSALDVNVLRQGLPLPGLRGRSLECMSAEQLEHVTVNALHLRHNWTSHRPLYKRKVDIFPPGIPFTSRARNLAVHYLPGRESRWLLTITFYDQSSAPREYLIHCWDVIANPPWCVGTLRCVGMTGATVNSDPSNPGVLALTRRGPSDTSVLFPKISCLPISARFHDVTLTRTSNSMYYVVLANLMSQS